MKKDNEFFIGMSVIVFILLAGFVLFSFINKKPDAAQNTTPQVSETATSSASSSSPVLPETSSTATVNRGSFGEPVADQLYAGINDYRVAHKLKPLAINHSLNNAAINKGHDMVEKGYWDHTNPFGKRFSDFIDEAGYSCGYQGENLARYFPDADSALKGWEASPTHNANLLGLTDVSKHYSEIGIYAVKLDTGYLIVAEFGGCGT